ncbi:MAG: cupin domain-containing protein [Deltaproteobacteria bacterium]|nr:cupin domain-containing protein [Candidatus Anaeroferrophillus wilburensis]MBN2890082.1 cupin domain-containing protein [Deltaproteobacteria bacterium]
MKHVHYTDVPLEPVEIEGAQGVSVRWVINEADGAKNFAMRIFEVEPEGKTPYHDHDFEHEVFILAGSGVLTFNGQQSALKPQEVVFIPGGESHNFQAGPQGLTFMCLIPLS